MTNATLASEYVTDTMGLVLRIEQRKMGSIAKSIFESVEAGDVTVYVPGLVFAEILYLSEKQKISLSMDKVFEFLKQHPNYKEYPLSLAVVHSAAKITDIRELHDRLIAGTAHLLKLDLITNDPVIQASSFVKTTW